MNRAARATLAVAAWVAAAALVVALCVAPLLTFHVVMLGMLGLLVLALIFLAVVSTFGWVFQPEWWTTRDRDWNPL